ncbi:Protein kinase domain/Protein tyrosine kinase/Kinase-like, putative [Angomonas deanei]|uniref:non-specific serine/threonine protein kinase n=1 Tax=Angomonas deanei TaxID=59799 RepID=A0A7G2CSH8_9TRYP|nr:Protein kinase domain/Protein tyrosine kinase/Kinase-like, putative [Angomonas deanei]
MSSEDKKASIEGKKVGEYTIGKKIGSGNFATVYECKNSKGQRFALKDLAKKSISDEKMEQQLLREICILATVKHKNVLQLVDMMQSTNHIYIVMELVTGGELFDLIVKNKKLTEADARTYLGQLLDGLEAMQRHNIAHRDIKPENLLLDEKGMLKISDFGLGNVQGGNVLQTICGTPNYVAPEVLSERGYNGFSADIWSCGVLLYVMVSGTMPFEDRNMNKLLMQIQKGVYRPLTSVSKECQDLMARMMQTDPRKRICMEDIRRHPWMKMK